MVNECMTTPIVSRIAYLTSQKYYILRSSPSSSPFILHWPSLTTTSPPNLTVASDGVDIGQLLLRDSQDDKLIQVGLQSHPAVLSRLLPHLPKLSHRQLVIHVAVDNDLSDVLLLRAAVPYVLYSQTSQTAHDHALLASKLTKTSNRPVLHIFHRSTEQSSVSELETSKVLAFMSASLPTAALNGHRTNGMSNGNGVNGDHGSVSSGSTTPLESPSPTPSLQTAASSLSSNLKAYNSVSLSLVALLRRAIKPMTNLAVDHPPIVVFVLGSLHLDSISPHLAVVNISLLSPLSASQILAMIPPNARTVVVLEQVPQWTLKWTPLYMEVALALQQLEKSSRPNLKRGVIGNLPPGRRLSPHELFSSITKQDSSRLLVIGTLSSVDSLPKPLPPSIPQQESSYFKVLTHVFGDRLEICNAPELVATNGAPATTPEFALGRVESELQERAKLARVIGEELGNNTLPNELHALLTRWHIQRDDPTGSNITSQELMKYLSQNEIRSPFISQLKTLHRLFALKSKWIIGSDAWSYDLGSSGIHHVIASGINVNLLIIDTRPYSSQDAHDPEKRKKDIGLYAMNYGDVYVASIAVYSSYGQTLQALAEADRFSGPSIIVAHLPYGDNDASPLSILKESKLAVDSGYWPLYRWDPSLEHHGKDPLSLDSEVVKSDLQEFMDRQNHLSQLVRSQPQLAQDLIGGMRTHLHDACKKKMRDAYDKLLAAIDGPPLLILYASDAGAAEKIAKRLNNRAKARGLASHVQTMDSYSLNDIADNDEYVVFVTSTAGQGEPPQNGRDTFKAINAALKTGTLFSNLKFSVFAMGDSHYWPRPEDAHYYNRPGKELNSKLELLGGVRIAELGLGDDQDADGPETGYKLWEPLLWKALGVDTVEVTEAEPEPITNENIKIASNFLRGTIAEGLVDETTGGLAPSDGQLTKFHGIYEQDDRDIREERKAQGLEPAFAFMIRCRLPGGVCTPAQWLAMDRIADEHGNGTFKMTTRQTFQFHGVIKRHLKPAIQDINKALMDTIAACGDVNRNVLCSSLPELSHLHTQAYHFAKRLSEKLMPKTTAYHEIWLDKKQVAGNAVKDVEPMYGPFYLPRKFKIAVAIPPNNDVDVFANDVGFIAIAGNDGSLSGFNVTAGGGMGVTHSNKKTYPRTGDLLGFCTVDEAYQVATQILLTQRDNGNRTDRKNARLKYTIDRMGIENFKEEVEKRLGFKLQPALPFTFDRNIDDFGWNKSADGKHNFTMFIENGRVADEPGRPFKSALRDIAHTHKGTFRLTANQHLILAGVDDKDLENMKEMLAKHKLDNLDFSGLRLSSSACVAFPTCGLAMAESERYLPVLIDKVEKMCEAYGLRHDSIVMRMTGCPNGCARPYLAEVAFVGKSEGAYLMLLGGGYYGQRLNKIYRENVTEPEILAILDPMIKHYALERLQGERFGDFVIRAGYISPTKSGKEWYDGMGGEGIHKEVIA